MEESFEPVRETLKSLSALKKAVEEIDVKKPRSWDKLKDYSDWLEEVKVVIKEIDRILTRKSLEMIEELRKAEGTEK